MTQFQSGKMRGARGLKTLGIITTVGMFFINIMGFVDTETNSTMGCGADWPLCNGQFIPSRWNSHTIIEYAHRAVVGLVSFLLIALAIWAWRRYPRRKEVHILVIIAVGFVIAQAALGAMAVFFTNPPTVLAIHFGFSLLAFIGVLLLTVFTWQVESSSAQSGLRLREVPAALKIRRLVWFALVYTYAAVYYGAFVSSTGVGEACRDWPLCNGQLIPPLSGAVGLDFAHRVIALGALLVAVALVVTTRASRQSRPDLYRGSLWVLVFMLLQALSGGYLVYDKLDLNAFLLHVSIMSGLWGFLCYLGLQVLPASKVSE